MLRALLSLSFSLPLVLYSYDGDGSGVSDLYEAIHGLALPADGDFDKDGYANLDEYRLGSDPVDPASPGPFLQPTGNRSFEYYLPTDEGLRYRIAVSDRLEDLTFPDVYTIADGAGGYLQTTVETARFFRLEAVPPLHSDADLLDDWEEAQLGTSKTLADSDDDLLLDHEEAFIHATDPLRRDTDIDGFNDVDEIDEGSDPNDPAGIPAVVLRGARSVQVVENRVSGGLFLKRVQTPAMVLENTVSGQLHFRQAQSAPMVLENLVSGELSQQKVSSAVYLVENFVSGSLGRLSASSTMYKVENLAPPPAPKPR